LVSISVFSVGLRITLLNGMSIASRKVSSAIAGISLCRTNVLRSGSRPTASQSLTIPMVLARISAGFSASVVKAWTLAMRK